MPAVEKYLIFLASPGDVRNERKHVFKVVEELNRTVAVAKALVLQVVSWETDALPGYGTDAQDLINAQIDAMSRFAVFVGIMWNRIGTPTPRAASGTVEEFDRAVHAAEKCGRPNIWFYFRDAAAKLDTPDALRQREMVLAFRERVRAKGLPSSYSSPADFRDKFRSQMTLWLNAVQWKNFQRKKGLFLPASPAESPWPPPSSSQPPAVSCCPPAPTSFAQSPVLSPSLPAKSPDAGRKQRREDETQEVQSLTPEPPSTLEKIRRSLGFQVTTMLTTLVAGAGFSLGGAMGRPPATAPDRRDNIVVVVPYDRRLPQTDSGDLEHPDDLKREIAEILHRIPVLLDRGDTHSEVHDFVVGALEHLKKLRESDVTKYEAELKALIDIIAEVKSQGARVGSKQPGPEPRRG